MPVPCFNSRSGDIPGIGGIERLQKWSISSQSESESLKDITSKACSISDSMEIFSFNRVL
jgi:hypothetical protein